MGCPRRPLVLVVSACALVILFAAACSNDSSDSTSGGNFRVMMSANAKPLAISRDAGRSLGTPAGARVTLDGSTAGAELLPPADSDEGDDDEGPDSGNPDNAIVEAAIRVSDLEARSTTLQQLIDVETELPVEIDLLELDANGGAFELAAGSLPADTYDELVIVISALLLTTEDGTHVTIEPPGGGWTREIRTEPFEVIDGQVTTIELQLKASSFHFDIGSDLNDLGADDFDPEFEIVIGP